MPSVHSGRLPKHFQDFRNEMLHMFTEEMTLADMRNIARQLIRQSLQGNLDAMRLLFLYILPAPPKELKVSVDSMETVRFLDWAQPWQLPDWANTPTIDQPPQLPTPSVE